MELWDDWDDFLKGIAFDHNLTVEQKAVFFVRLSRQSIDSKRKNQDIANEVIGGEPDTALYAYNKRMKEVFDKLSQSFPEINSETRGKVERTQACLEQVYLEEQNKKKSEASSSAIAPPDWQKICREMLESQKQSIRRQATEIVSEPFYVQLGLVERRHQPRRDRDFSLSPEQGSGFFQLDKEEIIETYEHDEFLEQVIKQGQSKKRTGKRIAIIGEPGAGKTTLLEAIAFSPHTPGLPIWISLGSLGEKSLEEYLCQKWLKDALKTSDVTEQQKALEELFKSGEVLLLLDGVDEMPAPSPVEALGKIREELTGWVADARVVLTCRQNVWDASVNALQGFDTYRTLEFSYGDGNKCDRVREFICKWFSKTDKPDLGEPLREKLDEDRHQRIRDLVKNPLRLSLLCQSWYFHQGDLPKTKAALYKQFREAFYEWKKESFPTGLTERKELNAALGLLARDAIDKEKFRFGIRESFALDVMGEDLFNLACKLHWLNFVYKDAETDEKVYAFFHPTFQEYFAACAIDNWDYFLNHIPHNPVEGTYRIFEHQWKEVFLLWLGREEVTKEQKEELIWELGEFEDGCDSFYWFRAYFLAAAGIAQFQGCRWTDQIVDQLIKWRFGYFENDKQGRQIFLSAIAQAARAALLETNRSQVIKGLTQLLNTHQDEDILLDAAIILVQLNASDKNIIIDTLSKLLHSKNKTIRSEAAYRLGVFVPVNSKAIDTLKDCLNNSQSNIEGLSTTPQTLQDSLSTELGKVERSSVALKLLQIDPGNLEAIEILSEPLGANPNKSSLWQNNRPLAQLTIKITQSSENLSVEIVLNDAQLNYIDALTRMLRTSQDNLTRGLLIGILGKVARGSSEVASELIRLLHTSQDWCFSELAVSSLMTVLESKMLSATVQDLKSCLVAQVKENNLVLFWFSYKVIWYCAQNMTYSEFYQAWHGEPSPVQPLKTKLIDIPSQLYPTDKTYPIAIDAQSLKLETSQSTIAQKFCTKIHRKADYFEIPTASDAAQLQQHIPRIQEKLQKPNLALILHGCEPNEHLINFCYSVAERDLGIYIGLITSQPIEQPLKGFLPNQDNLLSAIQSWINEIG